MRINEICVEQRPRERLKEKGVECLNDAELLAVILQNGSKGENVIDMSHRLISSFGLDKLNSLSLSSLMKIKGIGMAKACKIIAALELSKRVNSGRICEKVVNNASDVASYYMEKLRDKKKEYFIAVFLDSKNKIIGEEVISIGTLNSSLVHPREVFKSAIQHSANSIILVHNHPSGDCEASNEDNIISEKLREAGEMIGIKLLDHIVVGRNNYQGCGL